MLMLMLLRHFIYLLVAPQLIAEYSYDISCLDYCDKRAG